MPSSSIIINHDDIELKFPHIDEIAMDELQKKELEQRLMLETKEIRTKFNILRNVFLDSLKINI